MFGFIKDKLKKAVSIFKGEEEKPKEEVKEVKPPKEEKKKEAPKEEKKAPTPLKKEAPSKIEPKAKSPKAEPVEIPKAIPDPEPVVKAEAPAAKQEAVLEKPEVKPAPKVEARPEPKVEPPKPVVKEVPKAEAPKPIIKEEQGTQSVPVPQIKDLREPKKTEPVKEDKLGFFGRLKAAVTTKKITREEYEDMFTEFEMDLLENNVALEVVDKIKEDLWEGISSERFNRFSPEKRVLEALKQSISELFMEPYDILKEAKKKDLYIICAVGVNGSGKTTTLAKLAHYFKENGMEPVLAAGDTFRAAAIQQLEEHANRIGVKIIKQQYGADAAAVAYDAIQYAKANKARVVLIDTAGRLHSNTNLMEELKKIVRVAKPDTTIFIGEATTGNDCVYQATQFQQAVNIDGIVLAKADVDERGGASISISYVTKKPILFFGTGQTYDDLEPFDKKKVMEQLAFE